MKLVAIEVGLLRLVGAVELLAFVAVVMPRAWMEAAHLWLGLGEMPRGAVVDFMIRQASFTYGLHGIFLWIVSLDPDRFRPLILFTALSYLIAGPVFLAIDWSAGMPWYWIVGDGGSCFCFGLALAWLEWKRSPPVRSSEAP